MKDLFQVITLGEAEERIFQHWHPPAGTEKVALTAALGRRLAGDLVSGQPVPGFDRSTVDGFAVRAADTFGASESLPALLRVAGEVLMGKAADTSLVPGQTAVVATGGMLPVGSDAVVMVEYTEKLDDTTVEISRTVAPGENVIRRGEDVAEGSIVLTSGSKIGPYEMGLAAAAGYSSFSVRVPLRVGIISTGEELVPPDTVPGAGQVRDINTYCLAGLVEEAGGRAALYGIVGDEKSRLEKVLAEALSENDLVVISGGSSVGVRDMTLDVLSRGLLFHGLAIRPGKPTLAAIMDEKLVIGLPGHPASAAIAFYLLVRPLLQGGNFIREDRKVWAVLNRNLSSGPGREDYVRVRLSLGGEDLVAVPLLGKSGLIHTLAQADGLIRIPLHKEGLAAGERVEVILI